MKKHSVLAHVFLAVVLLLCIAACDGGDREPAMPKGSLQTWGEISVFVPEGYALHGGAIVGSKTDDVKQCSIQPEKPNSYDYYWIISTTAEKAVENIATTKEVNAADDITVKANGTEWKGCHYLYKPLSGRAVDCGSIYRTDGDIVYQVNFAGHAPDSVEMTAVLASITGA